MDQDESDMSESEGEVEVPEGSLDEHAKAQRDAEAKLAQHFHMEWRRMCQISFWNQKSGLVLLSFARPLLCASRYSSIALASKRM